MHKAEIQSGVKEIIYLSDKYKETDSVKASKKMLDLAKVTYRQLDLGGQTITIDFSIDK